MRRGPALPTKELARQAPPREEPARLAVGRRAAEARALEAAPTAAAARPTKDLPRREAGPARAIPMLEPALRREGRPAPRASPTSATEPQVAQPAPPMQARHCLALPAMRPAGP